MCELWHLERETVGKQSRASCFSLLFKLIRKETALYINFFHLTNHVEKQIYSGAIITDNTHRLSGVE